METGMSETTGPKQTGSRFTRGTSGNPKGRPCGSRHAALLALDAIGAEAGTDIMRSVVTAAKGGDMRVEGMMIKALGRATA
jgi:hypothetical protein